MLSTEATTKLHTDSAVLFNIADHSLLYTHIPICYTGQSHHQPNNNHTTQPNRSSHPQPTQTFYKWIEGEDISEYSASARKWKQHTDTPTFIAQFNQIIEDTTITNEDRSTKVEEFLIAEAV
jgi:hypothetical protein